MNVLDAWRALQEGKDVKNIDTDRLSCDWKGRSIVDFLEAIPQHLILSDEWEIVKKKRKITIKGWVRLHNDDEGSYTILDSDMPHAPLPSCVPFETTVEVKK